MKKLIFAIICLLGITVSCGTGNKTEQVEVANDSDTIVVVDTDSVDFCGDTLEVVE